MPTFLLQLRRNNIRRCVSAFKHSLGQWSIMEWGCAAAGEMGELCNILKKIQREEQGIGALDVGKVGGDKMKAVADEVADVVIYLDLLCARCGIDLEDAIRSKFNETSKKVHFEELL